MKQGDSLFKNDINKSSSHSTMEAVDDAKTWTQYRCTLPSSKFKPINCSYVMWYSKPGAHTKPRVPIRIFHGWVRGFHHFMSHFLKHQLCTLYVISNPSAGLRVLGGRICGKNMNPSAGWDTWMISNPSWVGICPSHKKNMDDFKPKTENAGWEYAKTWMISNQSAGWEYAPNNQLIL